MRSSNVSQRPLTYSRTPNVVVNLTPLIPTTNFSNPTSLPPPKSPKLLTLRRRSSNISRQSSREKLASAENNRRLCWALTTTRKRSSRASTISGTTSIAGGVSSIWTRKSTREVTSACILAFISHEFYLIYFYLPAVMTSDTRKRRINPSVRDARRTIPLVSVKSWT